MVVMASVQAGHSATAAVDSRKQSTTDGQVSEVASAQTEPAPTTDAVSNFAAMHGLHGEVSALAHATTSQLSSNDKRGAVLQEIRDLQKQSEEMAAELKEAGDASQKCQKFGNWLTGSDGGVSDLNKSLQDKSAEL